ncbi:TIGR02099 family protein [Pseudoalteromonas rubra]|uniref:TIGR02099 family protein n=1 Tax=Pseudoalteromonas rubra TaxID=43658 RepID=A0A5S3WNW7_9GAMM|nr:YhdP family protein [Pseudoalteromonas rubra]TMP30054.1 TIGR02099 family protein [Pseudoalteromonas rubra]TMP35677.1 TIGR02099 family protein [Pseudoalteromonas rubra]
MMQLKTVCFFCVRKMWQVFAVTLVLLAVLVSVVKYSLPYANEYKNDIESLLYQQLGVELNIGSISASWQGNGPALVLRDVSFEDNLRSPISLHIAQTSLQLNLVESVRQWRLVSSYFVLDGFDATLDIDAMTTGMEGNSGEFEQQALIEELFLGDTGHFAVQNSQVTLLLADDTSHTLLVPDLIWQNSADMHHGEGQISVPGLSKGQLNARFRFHGQQLNAMAGDIFIDAQQVEIISWLQAYLDPQYSDVNSSVNLQLWAQLEHGQLKDVLVDWLPSHISWQQEQVDKQLAVQGGSLYLQPAQSGWTLHSSELQLSRDKQNLTPMSIQGQFSEHAHTLWMQQLDLAYVAQLVSLTHFDWAKQVKTLSPVGQVAAARLSFEDDKPMSMWLALQDIGWLQNGGIPGFSGLNAELTLMPDRGVVTVSAQNQKMQVEEQFIAPLAVNELNGDIHFYLDEAQQWHVLSDNLWLSNDDLSVALEMHLRLLDEPELDLYADVFGGDASVAGRYFPLQLMNENLVEYLNTGIQGGRLKHTQVLLSGPLNQFPYRGHQGRFEVLAHIGQAQFAFAPEWAALQDGDVTLHFADERMDITVNRGVLLNQELDTGVVVSLADLEQTDLLTVNIAHITEASTLAAFFSATPIADPLTDILQVAQVQGEVTGNVDLLIDLASLDVNVLGSVEFNDNTLYLQQPGMVLDKLSGTLNFIDDNIELENTRALWRGMPLLFSLSGQGDSNRYRLGIETRLNADSDKLMPLTQGLMDGFVDGQALLAGRVMLDFTEQGFSYDANFTSDLQGVAVDLPMPVGKQLNERMRFHAQVRGDDISNLISVALGEQLYFDGILDNHSGLIERAQLVLANDNSALSKPGFNIAITQPQLSLAPWLPFIERIITQVEQPSTEAGILPAFGELRAQIAQLNALELAVSDFELSLTPDAQGLQARLNGKELRAQVQIPDSYPAQPIQIQADYLRLNPIAIEESTATAEEALLEEDTKESHQWLASIPAIEFNCDDCRITQYQLDKVNLVLAGNGEELLIEQLSVDKGDHLLTGRGGWRDGKTYFNGTLASDDFGQLMEEFDITSSVQDSSADIEFALSWADPPYEFDVASLDGEVKWQLGEGHLTEISDQGTRVFSLLSLDSLVRKLKLDFRDVFAKGFFYNRISGTFQLNKGVVYTEDTQLDGVPADLSAKGYADLNSQAIDYELSVAPQVTSSLPVIVGWMVNPVTGLAALAIDKVIHSARVISEIKFKVTGTMSEPVVTELDRKSREVELPKPPSTEPDNPEVPVQPQLEGEPAEQSGKQSIPQASSDATDTTAAEPVTIKEEKP